MRSLSLPPRDIFFSETSFIWTFFNMLFLAALSLAVGTLFSVIFEISPVNTLIQLSFIGEFVSQAASFVGIAITAYFYLIQSGRGDSYIDIDAGSVDAQFVGVVSLAIAVSLALTVVFSLVTSALGVSAAVNPVGVSAAQSGLPVVLFAAIVLFFNAPAEELLFRNVIQKRLQMESDVVISLMLTSLIFVILHIPTQVADGVGIGTGVSMMLLFVVSTLFGVTYHLTGSLFAPLLTHAAYNLIQLGLSTATRI